ncbi:multicomponent Na+:H+ antiporter subunit D [Micromonospora phaseoli]|uniref:Multicomponent Na+:H+ antiporter subunit D n=1 Tax=Micromonospora phaseoli TaxID=1144548 RepID=A0A1H6RYR8_9ACTN|nr:Na+/H+ antiporter subunit D [Micromonospora phaseoli]PZW03560.1 multisubunit sodium/proton antiporter MrpD subunit [Micromonospora phaseoli]GIJ77126.1 Na+/H+ antiporter subunit D [Micromonospora phaseoli]SEI56645.1 multicomponent Na+:H+ antiporter subunit D [Micromonospora phaseoli]
MSELVPLPVVLPLLGAALTLLLANRPWLQRVVSVGCLSTSLVVAVVLLVQAYRHGPLVVQIGDWPAPVGIVLVADQLAALMLVVSSAVTLCVLLYSIGQGQAEVGETAPVSIFHPTYLVLTAGVCNAFLAGDLFNLFVGFEMLLAASFVLITLNGTGPRIRTGSTYVVVNVLASMIFLISVGLFYAATGTLNLAQLTARLDALPDGVRLSLQLMLLVAFGIKAAVFPLSAWLPDSYPTAPAPVTAVFAGLLTKVGVYAIIRTQTLLFPDQQAGELLMVAAGLTMVVGILGAVAQSDMKRLLSFTLVSHIGYMIFGVGLSTVAGLVGAIFYVVHHITIQTTLFLVTGLVEQRAGSTDLRQLGGLARLTPLLGVLFFVSAMNLAGIPPFSGFLGKLGLLQAGVAAGGPLPWTLVVVGTVTSLLTLYVASRVWNIAFWRSPCRIVAPTAPLPALMVGATVALVALGVALTVVAGPLFEVTAGAAADLMERTPYVRAVLPGGAS